MTNTGDRTSQGQGIKINVLSGGDVVERLYLEPGEVYRAEVDDPDFGIEVVE